MVQLIFVLIGLFALAKGKLKVTARRELAPWRARLMAGAFLLVALFLQLTAGASDEELQSGLIARALRKAHPSAFSDAMDVRFVFIGLAICAGIALTLGAFALADDVPSPPDAPRGAPARSKASRAKRLLCLLVDQALLLTPGLVIVGLTKLMGRETRADIEQVSPIIGLTSCALYALQCWLVATSGQSLAKGWFGLRVVRPDGTAPGFFRGVALRSWLLGVGLIFPPFWLVVGPLLLLDALWIFGGSSRCLHDLVADTVVIQAVQRVQR